MPSDPAIQPDPTIFLATAGVTLLPIGLYDAPDPSAFQPLVRPAPGRWACIAMFFKGWMAGKTLHVTPDNCGCGGMGTYLLSQESRSREDYIAFLQGEEGLKATPALMGEWIDTAPRYRPRHGNVLVGPLKPELYEYLQTVTFFVNPDQLSLFVTGAYFHQGPHEPAVVTAPFASACKLMGPLDHPERAQAVIGATDIAMRQYLPPDILAFTVNRLMFERLCSIREDSFLGKQWWRDLRSARGAV